MPEELEYDKRRDPEKYAHIWLGEYQRTSEASVFRNWRVEAFETPDKVERFYFGADWGFSVDPTVLVRAYIVDKSLFIDAEAYAIGCTMRTRHRCLRVLTFGLGRMVPLGSGGRTRKTTQAFQAPPGGQS